MHHISVSFPQNRSGMIRRIPCGQTGLCACGAQRLAGGEAKGRAKGGRGCVGVYGLYRAGCRRCHVTRRSKRRGAGEGQRSRRTGGRDRRRVERIGVIVVAAGLQRVGVWSRKHETQGRDANASAGRTELYRDGFVSVSCQWQLQGIGLQPVGHNNV